MKNLKNTSHKLPNISENNRNTGKTGEEIALQFLLEKGYFELARNINFSNQEVDIIAKKENKYYIIEVKTSSINSLSEPEDYMTPRKLKNLKKAAYYFSRKNKIKLENIYFDLVAIKLNKSKRIAKIRHYKNIC